MWTRQDLSSHSKLQVLLVPLGGIEKNIYDRYCSLFRFHSAIPLQELTAPGDWTRQNCPFRHFSWTEGTFNFHFVKNGTTDGGLSEWGDYQAHRRVYAALGIVHEPSCSHSEDGRSGLDLAMLQAELALAMAPYPHASIQRLFVFEHSFEAGNITGYDAKSCVILPPEPEGDQGTDLLKRFLCEPLHNIAVTLVIQIEDWVRSYAAALSGGVAGKVSQYMVSVRTDVLPPLRTIMDNDNQLIIYNTLSSNGNANGSSPPTAVSLTGSKAEKVRAKRRWGRLRKWVGDLCLLAGTPKDAVELYDAASAELSKSDPLWYAGALEGCAACLVALSNDVTPIAVPPEVFKLIVGREQDGTLSTRAGLSNSTSGTMTLANTTTAGGVISLGSSTWTQVVHRGITERCQEALRRLSDFPVLAPLEVELSLKVARFYVSEFSKNGNDFNLCDEALSYIIRSLCIPDIEGRSNVERAMTASALCAEMGLNRKSALFLYLASLLSAESEGGGAGSAAHALGRASARAYGVKTDAFIEEDGESEVNRLQASWVAIRKHLLQHLLDLAARCGDDLRASMYSTEILNIMGALESSRLDAEFQFLRLPVKPSNIVEMPESLPPILPSPSASTLPHLLDALRNMSSDPILNVNWTDTSAGSRAYDSKTLAGRIAWGAGKGSSLRRPNEVEVPSLPPVIQNGGPTQPSTSHSHTEWLPSRYGIPYSNVPINLRSQALSLPRILARRRTGSFRPSASSTNVLSTGGQNAGLVGGTVSYCAGGAEEEQAELAIDVVQCAARVPRGMTSWGPPVLLEAVCPMCSVFNRRNSGLVNESSELKSRSEVVTSGGNVVGGFYFSPFGRGNLEKEVKIEWEALEYECVVARFRNPLAIPLEISSASCCTSGIRCLSPPVSFTLPPHCPKAEVLLYIVPQEAGEVTIEAVTLTALNLNVTYKLQKDGSTLIQPPVVANPMNLRPKKSDRKNLADCKIERTHVNVLKAMPRLVLESDAIKDIRVYPGEERKETLQVVNHGKCELKMLEIWANYGSKTSLELLYSSKLPGQLSENREIKFDAFLGSIEVDSKEISRQLYLAQNGASLDMGGSLHIPMLLKFPQSTAEQQLQEMTSSCIHLVLKYSNSLDEPLRMLSIPLSSQIIPGLRLESITPSMPMSQQDVCKFLGNSDSLDCKISVVLNNEGSELVEAWPRGCNDGNVFWPLAPLNQPIKVPPGGSATAVFGMRRLSITESEVVSMETLSPLAPLPVQRSEKLLLHFLETAFTFTWRIFDNHVSNEKSLKRIGTLIPPMNMIGENGIFRKSGVQCGVRSLGGTEPIPYIPQVLRGMILPDVQLGISPCRFVERTNCFAASKNTTEVGPYPVQLEDNLNIDILFHEWQVEVLQYSLVPVFVVARHLKGGALLVSAQYLGKKTWEHAGNELVGWTGALDKERGKGENCMVNNFLHACFLQVGMYRINASAKYDGCEVLCAKPMIVTVMGDCDDRSNSLPKCNDKGPLENNVSK